MTGELGAFDPKATYSGAAADYERAGAKYWNFSPATIDLAGPRPGESVLDVACGPASGLLLAAERVGPGGRVVGVDYAEGMVEIAREKVRKAGLANVEVVQGDMTALPYAAEFDVVMCVLGIFFLDDMPMAAAKLWSHVRPGGRLAITTIGFDVWRPMLERFVIAVQQQRPDLDVVLPWRRTEDPAVLQQVMSDAGIPGALITSRVDDIPFEVADWWTIVMGSGLRSTALQLGEAAATVREDNERWAREQAITSVRISSNYALAAKPA
jgi:SAM-dependent methyltransferase